MPSRAHFQKCTSCPLSAPVLLLIFPSDSCWFGPYCSTWRLWPMSTSATERSGTVWTSWSTWRVSVVVGTRQLFPLAKMSRMAFSTGKRILWIFISLPIHSSGIRSPCQLLYPVAKYTQKENFRSQLFPWKAQFRVEDFHWAQVYLNARETSIVADFGKNVFCFLLFLLKCQSYSLFIYKVGLIIIPTS